MAKVFGHCAAGCDYEVPTKDEFNVYRAATSRFPAPTKNTAKKLTESGYYYIKTDAADFGIVYWEKGKKTQLPSCVFMGETAVTYEICCVNINTDGYFTYLSGGYFPDEGGWVIPDDLTSSTNFYTAKIVDTDLPDLADGESY